MSKQFKRVRKLLNSLFNNMVQILVCMVKVAVGFSLKHSKKIKNSMVVHTRFSRVIKKLKKNYVVKVKL